MPSHENEEETEQWEKDKLPEVEENAVVEALPETEIPAAIWPVKEPVFIGEPRVIVLDETNDESKIITGFVEWLATHKGIFLAEIIRAPGRRSEQTMVYARPGIQALLEEFFKKDLSDGIS